MLVLVPDLRRNAGFSLTMFSENSLRPAPMSFSDAIKIAGPAVVNIYSTSYDTRPLLYRRQPVERTSLGSGVIMTNSGHILTCYHVIQNAERINVILQDGRVLEAQLVGQDLYTDLAVLKVNAPNLPVIPQQQDMLTQVGDLVLAIGNPYNLGQTITQGIVSATGRSGLSNYMSQASYADFIQMDAVLNEGNSGGALVDSNGTLIGINNANFKTLDSQRRLKDVAGIFFAVPYTLAKRVMDDIIAHGRVIRGYLGISGNEYVDRPGIRVTAVDPLGPAAKAGIMVNDVLLKIDGQTIESAYKTLDLVAESRPGSTLHFELLREEQVIEVAVTITELANG
ncbi:trypsin-like peptidase domain-containing protein [Aliiglaciecola sp. CAU 1673]|uniref:trypsin-like peptidase domain-containing protein n=1 Tax=Aliiglaciecola sp. CAU 1673 TaxID=3032595 RepID=UPI0023DA5DFA|nr:trypsin-like peptidase domain-containing protein [Aliiglaciecola sp. CAU 1673]MDF2178463.1 trypsin-like peptidase domain-containing protein [Aliiglaciecola sp. CAU 1673]